MAQVDSSLLREIIDAHLNNPTVSAKAIAEEIGAEIVDIKDAYRILRMDQRAHELVDSPYYPYRLFYNYATTLTSHIVQNPKWLNDVTFGSTYVTPVALEIHPTKGTCQFNCAMCLWSDKNINTYAQLGLARRQPLSTQDWSTVLKQIHMFGTNCIAISGGGEPLLNSELADILSTARVMGLAVDVFTNGFGLDANDNILLDELLRVRRLRLSIQSPDPVTYSAIVGIPVERGALDRVHENMRLLLATRHGRHADVRVGVGFVIQPANYHQILDMARFASGMGVDFLDVRIDEIQVAGSLTDTAIYQIIDQLRVLRCEAKSGLYGSTRISMADRLTALANGTPDLPRYSRPEECLIKHLKPTINPFGDLYPCDLKAEPRFSQAGTNFGSVQNGCREVLAQAQKTPIQNTCDTCMPGSRAGNAILSKIIKDSELGISVSELPFFGGSCYGI